MPNLSEEQQAKEEMDLADAREAWQNVDDEYDQEYEDQLLSLVEQAFSDAVISSSGTQCSRCGREAAVQGALGIRCLEICRRADEWWA